jgi:hypothetical protein
LAGIVVVAVIVYFATLVVVGMRLRRLLRPA